MAALGLTDESWTGLPLLACNMDPGLYRIDVDTPMLIIRDDLGTDVEVLDPSLGRRTFRQAALRFDLFTPGQQLLARSDRPATQSLVVALPLDWLPVDDGEPDRRLALRPRFQFGDVALRRLVWRLVTHHRNGEPLGHDYNGAVSRFIVDRVTSLQLAEDARAPDGRGLDSEAQRIVRSLVDDCLQDPPSVADLAAKVGMGLARFAREFRSAFAVTPHQYVIRRRVERACELLRHTDASLAAIAIDTGFASQSHMTTVFRAGTGLTPSAYRIAAAG